MKISPEKYLVRAADSVDLKKRPTIVAPFYSSKDEHEKLLEARVERLRKLQQLLYATERYALLIVLQGMDTAGKDGIIRHVMSGVNPQGCEVHSFKRPTEEELHHDFLWRAYRVLPPRGKIGVFNRSHYEEMVVVRVHPELLVAQGLEPDRAGDEAFWNDRYRAITEMERHLHGCGTRIVKLMLHMSQEEQRKRLLARIDEPEKNWKFNAGDIAERGHWTDYMKAYESCLSATSTEEAPWFVVPADDKLNARLIAAEIIVGVLERMDLHYPEIDDQRREELEGFRRTLEKPLGSAESEKDG